MFHKFWRPKRTPFRILKLGAEKSVKFEILQGALVILPSALALPRRHCAGHLPLPTASYLLLPAALPPQSRLFLWPSHRRQAPSTPLRTPRPRPERCAQPPHATSCAAPAAHHAVLLLASAIASEVQVTFFSERDVTFAGCRTPPELLAAADPSHLAAAPHGPLHATPPVEPSPATSRTTSSSTAPPGSDRSSSC
jgi:hypothetical protein